MCMFATRKSIKCFFTFSRKRRDMIHKMVVLASLSVLTVLCTFVFNAYPEPAYPSVLYKSGISKLGLLSKNNEEEEGNVQENADGATSGELTELLLNRHHRNLQFTSNEDDDKGLFDTDDIHMESESESNNFKAALLDLSESPTIGPFTNKIKNSVESSKVIHMSADISLVQHADKDVKISHIPRNHFQYDIEEKLNNDKSELIKSKFNIRHEDKSTPHKLLNTDGQTVDNFGPTPKPNRNASNRNTSEVPVQRLPHAIIIGVKKSGTRALLEFLRIHPSVEGPGPEPHFFDRNYDKGLDWYRSLMPKTYEGQITIEKTPSYFVTQEAPQRMLNMNPDVKLILVVRDPVTRAISDYCQATSKRRIMPPFEAMAMVDQRRGVVNATWGAIRIGLYYKHMEKWLEVFKRKQIHLVDMQKLITEPAKELAKVERFLHLAPFITENHFYLNKFKGTFPCLVRRGKVHCLDGRSKGREHPKVKQNILKRLRKFYQPFNAKFYQMVGKTFAWSE